jgi:hypothetical protein
VLSLESKALVWAAAPARRPRAGRSARRLAARYPWGTQSARQGNAPDGAGPVAAGARRRPSRSWSGWLAADLARNCKRWSSRCAAGEKDTPWPVRLGASRPDAHLRLGSRRRRAIECQRATSNRGLHRCTPRGFFTLESSVSAAPPPECLRLLLQIAEGTLRQVSLGRTSNSELPRVLLSSIHRAGSNRKVAAKSVAETP